MYSILNKVLLMGINPGLILDASKTDKGELKCHFTAGGDFILPDTLWKLIQLAYNLIKVGIPILLIIFGMLDLGKAVMAQKDEDIKKAQTTFIKRLGAAALVFLVMVIVQMVIQIVSGTNDNGIWKCVDAMVNGLK